MKIAQVQTRCECQAVLTADVDASGRVQAGRTRLYGEDELAPATGMNVGHDQFQVGWLCNICGRNTVRSFYRGALVFRDVPDAPAASAATV